MGLFLAVSAFRRADPKEVAQACADYFISHGVDVRTLPPDVSVNHETDVFVHEPQAEWTVTLWPQYFGVNVGAAARAMAAEKDWLISTVKVYDGDYWEHLAYCGLEELHSYCSRPDYWDEEGAASDWESDPERLAGAVGVSAESLQPYLNDVAKMNVAGQKARAEDEYDLSDVWVFVDFWRRLGVAYPEPDRKIGSVLRIVTEGYLDKLPV